tara:strand:+ start:631 stop:2007 length:1377 start_codon:yes stop_codon:yes gene_type:complete
MTSTIKVNTITTESGSTLTIGGCGKTVALASGASQTGFGREGSVDWQTGSIKTAATFTAASGEGYFVDTSSNAITANLPAGSAGAIVAFSDYARNFATNNLTISANGSEKIGGFTQDAILDINGQAATFVYVDSTKGWINVQNAEDTETGIPPFIQATGGTITESGNCKIHTFTGPGTFTVCRIATCCAAVNNLVSYMVVAGGAGGGGASRGGGGGAGGFRELVSPGSPYTGSPLNGYPTPGNRVTVTATSFPITVGGGGAAGTNAADGGVGSNSIFSTITSAGGGQGRGNPGVSGGNGGSGGGGAGEGGPAPGGTGNTPPTTPAQGTDGGAGRVVPGCRGGGGGGGATVAGQPGQPPYAGGDGGAGATTEITASPVAYAGGGGGGGNGSPPFRGGTGGTGGGGDGGGKPAPTGNNTGVAGTANTGGGGGGAANPTCNPSGLGSAGGSGIVIIRYKFQ